MVMIEKKARNEEMYKDHLNGMSMYDIAIKFGIRQPTVHEILKRLRSQKQEKGGQK